MTTALVQELVRLPPGEKLQLIDALWQSLDAADVPLQGGQVEEVQRRYGEMKANPAIGLSLDQLKARLR